MSLLLLFLRPKGFKDNVLNDTKRPLYYIVLLDVIRVLSNLLLAFIMGFYPRDVPEYSDIVFHFKDNLLLEADGRGSKTNSRSRSYGSTSKRTNPLDIRVSDGDREVFMFPSNINSNESNYFSDSTDGEEQFSPRTQENIKRIDMIKHALRTGNVDHAAL